MTWVDWANIGTVVMSVIAIALNLHSMWRRRDK